ncbi:MAG: trimeric intracellular cation channel family protein [Rickettsiales bacterium]
MQSQSMYLASMIGSIAFAISGFLVGTKNKLDWIGLFMLSFLTANGGGIIRDMLVNRMPLALSSDEPFLIVFAVTILGTIFRLNRYSHVENNWLFVVCDAVGLVAFAITGALVASVIGAPFFGYIMLAFLTATGGAILRDILVNNIPEVLHSGFYGSIAILVAASIYFLDKIKVITPVDLLAIAIIGLLLRVLAYRYRWRLPKL